MSLDHYVPKSYLLGWVRPGGPKKQLLYYKRGTGELVPANVKRVCSEPYFTSTREGEGELAEGKTLSQLDLEIQKTETAIAPLLKTLRSGGRIDKAGEALLKRFILQQSSRTKQVATGLSRAFEVALKTCLSDVRAGEFSTSLPGVLKAAKDPDALAPLGEFGREIVGMLAANLPLLAVDLAESDTSKSWPLHILEIEEGLHLVTGDHPVCILNPSWYKEEDGVPQVWFPLGPQLVAVIGDKPALDMAFITEMNKAVIGECGYQVVVSQEDAEIQEWARIMPLLDFASLSPPDIEWRRSLYQRRKKTESEPDLE